MGNFGEVTGSPDAGPEAPDAVSVRPVYRQPGTVRVRHRTLACASDGVRLMSRRFAVLPGFKSGEHRTVRCSAFGDPSNLQTSLSLGPVCTGRVRWQLAQRPVLCRLPLDSDTWLFPEHWTQGLSILCPLKSVW